MFLGDDRGVIVRQEIKQLVDMCQAPVNTSLTRQAGHSRDLIVCLKSPAYSHNN